MKTGKIIKVFTARDGRQVVLRTPKWEDLDDLLELINSLVDEGADILIDRRVSREGEVGWLSKALSSLEKDEVFYLVTEVEGRVVANSEISRGSGYEGHVGAVGIVVKSSFRDLGIGTEMLRTLVEKACEIGLKVLTLSVYASNKHAIHVYEKTGFTVAGRIPRRFLKNGEYVDSLTMVKFSDGNNILKDNS